jgi:hypothetical protein
MGSAKSKEAEGEQFVPNADRYDVPHPDDISIPPRESAKRTYVVVHRDDGYASMLPWITITSLSSRSMPASRCQNFDTWFVDGWKLRVMYDEGERATNLAQELIMQ